MPWSDYHLRPQILDALQTVYVNYEPTYFTDIGPGGGSNIEFYRPFFPGSLWTGVEVFEPYVERFELHERYDRLIVCDARDYEMLEYIDVVFLCDVLEHMEFAEALDLFDRVYRASQTVVVQVPLGEYLQGPHLGNEQERHLTTWTQSMLEKLCDHPGPVLRSKDMGAVVVSKLGPHYHG